MTQAILVLLVSALSVTHLDPVAVLKKIPARLLAPPRRYKRLRARAPIGPSVHQHLSRDHVLRLTNASGRTTKLSESS